MIKNIIISVIAVSGVFPAPVIADVVKKTATELMQAVDGRYEGDTSLITLKVLLIDKNNNRNQRNTQVVSKTFSDVKKSATFITHPPRIQGTGFLSYDWASLAEQNESWIYLPDLRKVTRLSTANRGDYFLGSDFSYGDLEGLEVQDFTFSYSTDTVPAKDGLTLVLAEPRADKRKQVIDIYGYEKISYWIDADKKMIIQAKYWLDDNGWIKYYKASNIREFSGVWVAQKEQMVLTQHNKKVHSTVMTVESVSINENVNDGVFTTYGLEKGRL